MVMFILVVLGIIVVSFLVALVVFSLPSKTLGQIESKIKDKANSGQ